MTAQRGHWDLDDHVDDEDELRLEDNPVWQRDNIVLTSVGLDVGSAGTQVVFSRLHLRRASDALSSRYRVVGRDLLHESPVELTPYRGDLIDGSQLGGIVDRAYAAAGLDPDSVDTGVVILTGEALRRRNAKRITEVLAERAGDVVSASAGHHMEARLAAFGSGAVRTSYEQDMRVLNIDVGGGTTKLAIADRGAVVATAAVHVGGRLVVTDDDDRVVRLEPAGARHAGGVGLSWFLGAHAPPEDLARVAASMADDLLDVIEGRHRSLTDDLLLTPPLEPGHVDGVQWSGGVAEYVYDRTDRDLRDLGPHLGRALRERAARLPGRQLPAGECIRATVMGASQYSTQMSGITSWIPDADSMLPRRNLRVLRPTYVLGEIVDSDLVAAAVRRHMAAFDVQRDDTEIVFALSFDGPPSHARLAAFARGLVDGLGRRLAAGSSQYLALDGDVAMTLGRLLRDELDVTVGLLILDGLELVDFDYVDLGRLREPSRTVPVTVKSLVFSRPSPTSL